MLTGGGSIWVLTVIDVYSRECVALEAQSSFRGEDVARIVGEHRGMLPALISVDNGTRFTSKAMDHWAYSNWVKLDFSRSGKPTDNVHVEAFIGSLRRECLSQHWITNFKKATRIHYQGSGAFTPAPERLAHLRA